MLCVWSFSIVTCFTWKLSTLLTNTLSAITFQAANKSCMHNINLLPPPLQTLIEHVVRVYFGVRTLWNMYTHREYMKTPHILCVKLSTIPETCPDIKRSCTLVLARTSALACAHTCVQHIENIYKIQNTLPLYVVVRVCVCVRACADSGAIVRTFTTLFCVRIGGSDDGDVIIA